MSWEIKGYHGDIMGISWGYHGDIMDTDLKKRNTNMDPLVEIDWRVHVPCPIFLHAISVSSPGPHRSQVRCCDTPGGCKGRQRRLAKERQRPKTAITKCTAPGSDWVLPSFLKTFL